MSFSICWLLVCALAAAQGPAHAGSPVPSPPPARTPTGAFELELPDMHFRQAPLAEILAWIRDRSREADPEGVGVNLILKDDAAGTLGAMRLTLRLTRPTVRQALELLATTAGLYIRRERNVAVIERSRAGPPSR
ncbi:MAG: hypothetical protein N2652_01590 [Kiritimatiellae bacterium]|nr:hypothetical protein [Kiritimatiellia bacterium]